MSRDIYTMMEPAKALRLGIVTARTVCVALTIFGLVVLLTRFIEPAELLAAIMIGTAALLFFLVPWVLRRTAPHLK